MSTTARVGGFALGLVAVAGAAATLGAAVGPVDVAPVRHEGGHGAARTPAGGPAVAAGHLPGGLAVSQDGYTLDVLDPALLRPGRFDRHVTVDRPDRAGRARILAVHTLDKPLAADADLELIARRTPGFTGADLANVVNEAALLSIRGGHSLIGMQELVEATERLVGGAQRRGRVLTEPVRRRIATHEAGHAIVATSTGEEVHRISVVARGSGLGATFLGSDRDAVLLTADELVDQIVVALSGRCAEELVLGGASTGSEGDLELATARAREMVTRHGMAARVGPIHLALPAADRFLHGESSLVPMSEELRSMVEAETLRLVTSAFARATDVLVRHRELLDELAEELLAEEVLDGAALHRRLAEVRAT